MVSPGKQTASAASRLPHPVRAAALDVADLRREFPALRQRVHGHPLVYLDNAATTHKPQSVIDTVAGFYRRDCSNVHRGLHTLSTRATAAYEESRDAVARFVGAADRREVVFTAGTTAGINLIASSVGGGLIGRGDEILVTGLEHHSNIVPWQLLCRREGATLRAAPIDDRGEVDLDAFEALLGPSTRLVAISHTSNALGTRNPVRRMADAAHRTGAIVVVDGAQALAHEAVDVAELGCDLLAFSGHKMYGPTGIGVLWGRLELLEDLPPWQGGGEMISNVTFEGTTFREPPYRFEAGTPNIAGAIGLGEAIRFIERVGVAAIGDHESDLLDYGTTRLSEIDGLRLIGTARNKAAILSFTLPGIHAHDAGTALDFEGIAVRAGHHCAQPVMDRYGLLATLRASLACYNTRAEIDALVDGLRRVIEVFG